MHPDQTNVTIEDLWPGDRIFLERELVRVVSIVNYRDRAWLTLDDNTIVTATWDSRVKRV